jgi:hypothetical protein
MTGAILPLPQYDFMAWCLVKKHRDNLPCPDRLWGPPNLPPNGLSGALSLGVKRPGREADNSPLSRAEIKNAWNYTSTSQYAFMPGAKLKHRENFFIFGISISEIDRTDGSFKKSQHSTISIQYKVSFESKFCPLTKAPRYKHVHVCRSAGKGIFNLALERFSDSLFSHLIPGERTPWHSLDRTLGGTGS